jgi:large subunit ribosomal protein L28
MSKVCEISGKRVMFGNNVSKALNRTKRRFDANIMDKRFYIPEEDKWVKLTISAATLKTINKKGISAVLKKAREKGHYKG